MRYQVTGKQQNSRMCLVCGLRNDFGLKTAFFELDSGELLGVFTPKEQHQSYPGRMHGGIAAAILDETIGRAIMIDDDQVWGVTVEFTSRYRQPVPLDQELRVIGRIEKNGSRIFEGSGEILLADGSVAVQGFGKYIKLPLDQIADFDYDEQDWRVVESENDPQEVEI